MRIVIDATAAVSGGKVYLDQLLPHFAREDDRYEFIVLHAGDFDDFILSQPGPQPRGRLRFERVNIPFMRRRKVISSVAKMLWRAVILPGQLDRLKPDLLYSNSGFVPKRINGIKTVIALHNSMPLREELIDEERSLALRLRLKSLRRLIHKSLRRADGAIVFSEDTKTRVMKSFPDLKREPAVVYHGIDWGERERETPVDFNSLSRLGVEPPYLLYVSQFHRYKNALRLLEAFGALAAKDRRITLVLAGDAADRGYWAEIENKINELGIAGRVIHIAACKREELITLYRGALAFVHPSLAETCSFPLLEAMALGVPIAAARASALPEMAGEAAIYFDPYDANDIAAKLEELICSEELRGELKTKAVERAAHFSWSETAQQTLNFFDRVAGS